MMKKKAVQVKMPREIQLFINLPSDISIEELEDIQVAIENLRAHVEMCLGKDRGTVSCPQEEAEFLEQCMRENLE